MATIQSPSIFHDEVVDFFASAPSRDQILSYRPSAQVQARASELLAKLRAGQLTEAEEDELDGFEQAELFLQLICARIHAH